MPLRKRPMKKPPFPEDAFWPDVERLIQHAYRMTVDPRYNADAVHNAKQLVLHKGVVGDCPPNTPGTVLRIKVGERKLHIGEVIWLREGS